MKDAPQDLAGVLERLGRRRCDRLAIIWDEFGRHLEGLAAEGRARDLHNVQQLAEWTARATKPQATLVLLMHQSLLAYASSINQTSRNEWRKVEGPVPPHPVRRRQPRAPTNSSPMWCKRIVQRNRRAGANGNCSEFAEKAVMARWFDGIEDVAHVGELLVGAYPLTAAALQALPLTVCPSGSERAEPAHVH